MNKNRLISGAIVIEGHVQGLSNTRSLGELGIPVYVVDTSRCLAQYSRYCTKYYRCPLFQSLEFIAFLIDIAQREHLKDWMLIASNDHVVENLSCHYDKLIPYYRMMVPSKSQLYDIIDKLRLSLLAQECGTHIPKIYDYKDLSDLSDNKFPLLIKGRRGLNFYKVFHIKAIQINSLNELQQQLNELSLKIDLSEIMIQEQIPLSEFHHVVSFTCFALNGEIQSYWMGEKLREHPMQYGTATMAQSVLYPEILEEAKPLIKKLNYQGVCEIEFMYDDRDGQYKLIEINPRTWLWVGLAKYCGIDYAKMMYRYLMGIPQEYPEKYDVGIKWMNRMTDFVYGVKSIFHKRMTVRQYITSLKGEKVYAIWSKYDILPAIMFPLMSFYIAKKRG